MIARDPLRQAERDLLAILRTGRPSGPPAAAEWNAVLRLALREGVASLVGDRLCADPAAPEALTPTFERLRREGADRTAAAYTQLEALLQTLAAAGIDAVLLKGAALARFTYEDGALRPFTDLDLLVRPGDVQAVAGVMQAAGYAAVGPALRTHAYEHCYFTPSWSKLPVDVHWQYAEPFHAIELDYGAVFGRASRVAVGAAVALVPAPEDLLVASSVEVVREAWESKPMLRYLCDIAEIVRRKPVDWDRVIACAGGGRHLRGPLRLSFGAARALLGVRVPQRVIEALRPRRGAAVDRLVQRRIRATLFRRPSPLEALARQTLLWWTDGEASPGYGALVAERIEVQWTRVRRRFGRRGRVRDALAR